jgi:hypothetical protein
LAQPARRRSEDDEPEYRADRVAVDRAIGYRRDHSIQRRQRQELQVGIRVAFASPPRSRGSSHRVADHPVALLGECKYGVQEGHDIAHCLGRESALEHCARQPLNVLSLDGVDAPLAERRRDVDALHRLAVLPIRQSRAFDLKAPSAHPRPRRRSGGRCSGALGGRRASASINRRKPRSASVRVSPSDSLRARILPMRRSTRRPSGVVQRP